MEDNNNMTLPLEEADNNITCLLYTSFLFLLLFTATVNTAIADAKANGTKQGTVRGRIKMCIRDSPYPHRHLLSQTSPEEKLDTPKDSASPCQDGTTDDEQENGLSLIHILRR